MNIHCGGFGTYQLWMHWVLLHVTGDNQNQQTLEQPPATHLAKPLLIVLTAVEARDGFPRINKTLGNKVVSQSHA